MFGWLQKARQKNNSQCGVSLPGGVASRLGGAERRFLHHLPQVTRIIPTLLRCQRSSCSTNFRYSVSKEQAASRDQTESSGAKVLTKCLIANALIDGVPGEFYTSEKHKKLG